jgi:2-keto-4-pentenoate hydratase/2-oxohepta-3-ene-1,7-dioic acid hydratase in catechol pathway|tara:strand:+ start:487 stop:1485 length:999 start_codon:yes stop_codon:yes gene_type:complete
LKFVTFCSADERQRLGVLVENETKILDLRKAHEISGREHTPAFYSMLACIEGGDAAMSSARQLLDKYDEDAIVNIGDGDGSVRLLTPLPRPPQIRDCLCFEAHLKQAYEVLRQMKAAGEADPEAALAQYERDGLFNIPDVWYRQPIYYKANRLSVIGSEEDIIWPHYADILDYELEFGFFIGKPGRDIPREKADEHIFGYSIFNDISARDAQTVEMPGGLGPAKGKDFDSGNVIGPCIVTADEIDPYNLTMIARVNGEEWSRGSSSTMHWKFEDLIAHVSQSETIHAGEFFGSGTVGGGCGLEQQKYLSPGDVIELEVEGIGVLRNRIIRQD